ncbi:MAG: alkaline phosphatase family protein [Desulfuromonadales bacterium]|nr:alkaline phosphatase family protein [Desulfuromonadales bacterium]
MNRDKKTQHLLISGIFRLYYHFKYWLFRNERRERLKAGRKSGFVGIQIDGLSHAHFQMALERGYLPSIARYLKHGNRLRSYLSGLPSTTPAAQAAIFYGIEEGIPAFRWFEKSTGQIISCNDPDHVQYFREKLIGDRPGILTGGSSYSNILDGGAAQSVFTVSSPHPQTLFGRFGGSRLLLLLFLHPIRVARMCLAVFSEYLTELYDRNRARSKKIHPVKIGLFPFIRIFCNVILREFQSFGVIADIYSGVPRIYTTYSGYDELAHQYGPASRTALKNLKYTDMRIGEVMRMLRYAPGADYQLILLSDHGQTPGYPFESKFGATLGDAVGAFLEDNEKTTISSGPLEFTRSQLGYLTKEIDARPDTWRRRIYRQVKDTLQRKIGELAPETLKVVIQGGIVITYSSSLAHLYFTGRKNRLGLAQIRKQQPLLLRFLSKHKGIGFLMAKGSKERVWFVHRGGELCCHKAQRPQEGELTFLEPYGEPKLIYPQLFDFAADSSCGDLIIFGDYSNGQIACFDDQIGGHGSVGGDQSLPFLILPEGHPLLKQKNLVGHAFLYHQVFNPLVKD